MSGDAGTDLDALLSYLKTARPVEALRRDADARFGTVEAVAAAHDRDLLDVRNFGPTHLVEVRAAVQAVRNQPPPPHIPHRGSDVEAWLKRRRDRLVNSAGLRLDGWYELDSVIDDYREHADTGTPLDREVEGPHGQD